ncbi:MAG: contractile injection system protein, VgrG/Pvc8 family, partial [Chloroflexaceae bacterium]|nr:contractile injection system protein, VgrG/Pvc8 family [Chloroflexaceae bacterium]
MTDTNKLFTQFYLQLDGQDAAADLFAALEQIEVESNLHLPAVATLVLHDPKLTWIDAANLAPGVALTVSVKVGTRPTPLFNGEIVEIEPDFSPDGQRLIVRAFDRLHRLARGRFARSFVNVTDGDLLKKLAAEVGLTAKTGPTPEVHPYVLQANESNLAFLQKRAAALGYLLYVKGTTLYCEAPAAGTTTELTYAQDLVTFRPRLSTIGQIEKVTVRSWDMLKKQEVVGVSAAPTAVPKVGETRKKVFNMEPEDLWPDCRVRTQAEATRLAQAVAEQHASRFIEAEGSCGGNPALVA